MIDLAHAVQDDLLAAIDRDDLLLPTLPEVALEIRKAAEDTDIGINELSHVIRRDPALSARLIKVVNSPLLRSHMEINNLQAAITRLGVNYTCNLAIGLVIEQIFSGRLPIVKAKLRQIWATSIEVAGISYELCRRQAHLKPDQGALAGMVHLIGVLPILTYAEEHNTLLGDPISLNHVIDTIHPVLGTRILTSWDFPKALSDVPLLHLDYQRKQAAADYADAVQLASLLNLPLAQRPPLTTLPAYTRLGMSDLNPPLLNSELDHARALLA